MKTKHYISLCFLFLFLFFNLGYAQDKDVKRYGIEIEFASETFMNPKGIENPEDSYKKPLEIIRKHFGDPNGEIKMEVWERRPELKYAEYKDPFGRTWKVVPESVNTTGPDGFEFVTPPLDRADDQIKLNAALTEIHETKLYGKGVRSSIHFNRDATHLFDVKGDASKLVDAILYIESKWMEIYSVVSPIRYGTIINRFGTPLAVNQPQLLIELSNMPKEQRSYENVKKLFERYHQAELNLFEGDARKAWKYRAGNYKKLFALDGEKFVPAIEFRILDFVAPERLDHLTAFFRQMTEKMHILGEGKKFVNPFSGLGTELPKLNEAIYNLDDSKYNVFLSEIGFTPDQYPKLPLVSTSPTFVKSDELAAKMINKIDFSKPVMVEGKAVTFGFEAEFRGGNSHKIVENDKVKTDKFSFLSSDYKTEGTGNLEVRSNVSKNLDETIKNMATVRKTLGGDLRGFHMHFRLPKSVTDKIPKDQLNAWFARISDTIFAWRLENRMTYLALKTWSNARAQMDNLSNRSTLRIQEMGEELDIEIRGYMTSETKIQSMVESIVFGLTHPEVMTVDPVGQNLLRNNPKSLLAEMSDFIKKYHGREITEAEKEALAFFDDSTQKGGMLPLMGFEFDTQISELDRVRIQNANFEFKKEVYTVLKNHTQINKYGGNIEEADKQFRYRIKRWAQKVEIEKLLKSTIVDYRPKLNRNFQISQMSELLLQGYGVNPDFTHSLSSITESLKKEEIQIIVNTLESKNTKLAKDLSFNLRLSSAHYTDLVTLTEMKQHIYSENEGLRRLMSLNLGRRADRESFSFLRKLMENKVSDVRTIAANAIFYRKDKNILDLLEMAVKDQDQKVLSAIMNSFDVHAQSSEQFYEIVETMIKNEKLDKWSKSKPLLSLKKIKPNEKVLELLKSEITMVEGSVNYTAFEVLAEYKDKQSMDLLFDLVKNKNSEIATRAAETITKRKELQLVKANVELEFLQPLSLMYQKEKAIKLAERLKVAIAESEVSVKVALLNRLSYLPLDYRIDILDQYLNHADINVKKTAIAGLANTLSGADVKSIKNAKKYYDFYAKLMSESNPELMKDANSALKFMSNFDPDGSLTYIKKMFYNPETRYLAQRVLQERSDFKSLSLLEKASTSKAPSLASSAIETIIDRGEIKFNPDSLENLKLHPNKLESMAKKSVSALRADYKNASTILKNALNHESEIVRTSLIESIEQNLTQNDFEFIMKKGLIDSSHKVNSAVAREVSSTYAQLFYYQQHTGELSKYYTAEIYESLVNESLKKPNQKMFAIAENLKDYDQLNKYLEKFPENEHLILRSELFAEYHYDPEKLIEKYKSNSDPLQKKIIMEFLDSKVDGVNKEIGVSLALVRPDISSAEIIIKYSSVEGMISDEIIINYLTKLESGEAKIPLPTEHYDLVDILLENKNPIVREKALASYAKVSTLEQKMLPMIIDGLNDSSKEVQFRAMEMFKKVKMVNYTKDYWDTVNIMLEKKEKFSTNLTYLSLLEIPNFPQDKLPLLKKTLHQKLQLEIAASGDNSSTKKLLKDFVYHSNPNVRMSAAKQLQTLMPSSELNALILMDSSESVKNLATPFISQAVSVNDKKLYFLSSNGQGTSQIDAGLTENEVPKIHGEGGPCDPLLTVD